MEIKDNFEHLSLHDASVDKIERHEDKVELYLKGILVSKKHPESNGTDWFIEQGQLTLIGVTLEETKFWDNNQAPKVHPEPEYPLDEIMNASFESGVFHLDGFKDNVPWYEWYVHADGFKLVSIKHKKYGS